MNQDELIKDLREKLAVLAQDADYWRAVFPKFTISDEPFKPMTAFPVDAQALDFAREQLREEGYFTIERIIPEAELAPYIEAVKAVRKRGFLPRFALVYDEFYQLMARLEAVLAPLLGENYYLVPDEFDIHYIENSDTKAGTPPHRDSLAPDDSFRADGLPSLLNVWISLVDVSAINSCIHVLPAQLDPYFECFGHFRGTKSEGAIPMQNIRALPVPAGSVLGWTPHLLHCGSRSSKRAPQPRMSLAVYFQSSDKRPYHKFAMRMPSRLPLAYRLYLIEKFEKDPDATSEAFKDFQSLWYAAQ